MRFCHCAFVFEQGHSVAQSIYAHCQWRCSGVQGNCSDPRPAEMLGLDGTDASIQGLLPLKLYQCLILVAGPWLAVAADRSVWVDNIYLKLWREHVSPAAALITAGQNPNRAHDHTPGDNIGVYITDVTFHVEGGHASGQATRSAIGVSAVSSKVYIDGAPHVDR